MSDEPDDLDAEGLAATLAACIEQLHHVRERVALLDQGSVLVAPDDIALMHTLEQVEALLTRAAAATAKLH